MTPAEIDAALDVILKAAGSGRLSNFMPYTQDKLREAMRQGLATIPDAPPRTGSFRKMGEAK
jgi:hypothetical protein